MEAAGTIKKEAIEILFENHDVVIINKPAGLIVHFDGRNAEPSVVDWVRAHYPEMEGVGEDWKSPQGEIVPRPGIVHRLDRSTSGVMILVKNQKAHAFIKRQFQERSIVKKYRLFVYGQPKADEGIIEAEIGRTKTKPRKWSAQFGKSGNLRAAITEWNVLARKVDPESGEALSYMEASPKTGRTHQIRVHMKALHHPIICDHIYAPKKQCLLGFGRPALHAHSVSLTLPSGEEKVFAAPLPGDFVRALNSLGIEE
ncbi:RNA pseudouridine synthase [Candidatus Kaiserbacteria bacterium CG10_big_fil_rev_8_21_14_0_10_49_17]|uniref:RNA pseudouridine synthase n=1 Tax=Candidatus Kaiserbacteria bacterium CG10_big_fil_rev_8_21_14_0_10_49_17 TaxID=1974609 RepID=A0A2M6WDN7_9BACT|nr:MAG: RNA pseudouridine synthase [Candidatus Kaiserbacteria bacterium CG10_big_fil_rev_8_21_14_0_10_49_17]